MPTRAGKDSLTTTGISTLHIAIAPHTRTVPASTVHGPSTTRSSRAAVSTASEPPIVRLIPQRRASSGALIPAAPKHSVGTEVTTLAHVLEASSDPRTSPSTDARLVTAGRMFAAARATPASRRPPPTAAV